MKSLVTFRDWVLAKESSPATRSKRQAALGLGPAYASVFGHSTPPPWQVERLTKQLKKKNKGKSPWTVPGEEPPEPKWHIPETAKNPDYSFDKWISSAAKKSKESEETKKAAEEEDERLNKEIADKKSKSVATSTDQKDSQVSTKEKEEKDERTDAGRHKTWAGHEKKEPSEKSEDGS